MQGKWVWQLKNHIDQVRKQSEGKRAARRKEERAARNERLNTRELRGTSGLERIIRERVARNDLLRSRFKC